MSASRLDAMYRSILLTKFFTKGWGKPENLRRLFEFRKVVSNRDECYKLVERDYPVTITKEQNLTDCKLFEGYFTTPLERYLPGIVPEVAQKAHFQVMLPNHWPEQGCKPVCLHLAGTGDHFFWRRRNLMVKPLLKEAGIGGIILENPFYGLRKPTDQVRSSLHNVSDIFVMGGCLILESLVLFHWCERNGLGPLGVTGLSMGGHMASLAATNWPKPLVLVPCLSWSTASAVFLQGVMSQSINWDLLEDQYLSDGVYREKLSKMVTIVDEAFLAGKKFARTYSEKIDHTDLNTDRHTDKINVTYKEAPSTKDANIPKKEAITKSTAVKKTTIISDPLEQTEYLTRELKKLLEEEKIGQVLYEKLSSNEKFELEPQDIEDINNLTEVGLREKLLKCKLDVKPPPPAPPQPLHTTHDNNTMDTSKPDITHMSKSEITQMSKSEITQMSKSEITQMSKSEITQMTNTNGTESPKTVNKQSIELAEQNNEETTSPKQETIGLENENPEIMVFKKEKPEFTDLMPRAECLLQEPKKDKKWTMSDLTSDLWNLAFFRSSGKKIDISKIHWRDREALQFMRGIMDECTHLSNFSVPFDTSLIIAVCAKHDAYVPREDVGTLEEIWPGAEVRYVDAGHVSAYILHQSLFRSCIIEAFERSKSRWHNGKHIN